MDPLPVYPAAGLERDRWILDRRPGRNAVDPHTPYAFLVEDEVAHTGDLVPVATIFLTNRECPWRCLMCDLWQNTLTNSVPLGAISAQIAHALSRLPPARHIKLYNSGSFFDPKAIPPKDYPQIAAAVSSFERVIVESHPSLVGERCLRLRDMLASDLEVAMGLETVHPEALERLNKNLTLEQFASAADRLKLKGIDLRVFILIQPPFIQPSEALLWAERSIDFAFTCGASAITLIPTRAGNGALEQLAVLGAFEPPDLRVVEAALIYGLGLRKGRVFVDLWDIARVPSCPACAPSRIGRLRLMNLCQRQPPPVHCDLCGPTP